jgi:hypothetical protein
MTRRLKVMMSDRLPVAVIHEPLTEARDADVGVRRAKQTTWKSKHPETSKEKVVANNVIAVADI